MTTFFITYNTGEYDSYHDHVYTIDAESKKALYAGISRAFDVFVDYQKKYIEARKEVDAKYRPKTPGPGGERQFKEYHIKLNEFFETYPYVNSFYVFGYPIAPFDEVMICEKDEAFKKAGFEIFTTDEYIEYCRPGKEI
jgi:hypothetical protein